MPHVVTENPKALKVSGVRDCGLLRRKTVRDNCNYGISVGGDSVLHFLLSPFFFGYNPIIIGESGKVKRIN